MTSEQFGLFPACCDDGGAARRRTQLAASGLLQELQVVGTEVCQRMPLEPGPQVFHGIEFRRIRGQEASSMSPAVLSTQSRTRRDR